MGEAQVIEGTTEEITARLREAYPAQTLRVTVEPQEEDLEEDLLAGMPPPPGTIRDEAHLIALLKEGLSGTRHKVTDETWEQRKAEVRRRMANRDAVSLYRPDGRQS